MRGVMLVAALLLAACGQGESAADTALRAQMVGKSVAGESVQTLDGTLQRVEDAVLFEKKPVVLNVWATWCSPCLREMPTLDALGKTGEFKVVAIATDASATAVKEFLKRQNWGGGIEVWHDPNGLVTRDKMGARAIPVTLLLDEKLTVKQAYAGPREWLDAAVLAEMRAALKR